ncbi:MAG: pyridoxamine 5'-phosphate oxidase family protein [Kiloniellales bacterium]
MDSYRITRRSRVKRLAKRGAYDRATVHAILDEALICHVAFNIDGHPSVIPTAEWRVDETLYLHGSAASRMLRQLAKGVELSIAVTLMDGLVLARSAFHSSINYRSVVIYGTGRLVEDRAEQLSALEAFVEKVTPGRWAEVRPPTDKELEATKVIAVPLIEVSAKIRTGPPLDDEEDYALDVWAGVLPLETLAGAPEADARLKPGIAVPAYLTDFNRRFSPPTG